MMMSGIVRLGADAKVKELKDGQSLMEISVAYNYGRKDAKRLQPTQWIRCVMWGERGVKIAEYLKRGMQIYVRLEDVHASTYERKDGVTVAALEAKLEDVKFLGGGAEHGKDDHKAPETAAAEDDEIPF